MNKLSNLELTKIFSKQWANVNDIKEIAYCGRDKAIIIRNEITKDILSTGKKLPICKQKLVPMNKVIEYLNINIDYIYTMAQKEKRINIMEGLKCN